MISRRRLLASSAALALGAWGVRAYAGGGFQAAEARLRHFVDSGALPFASLRVASRGRVLLEAHVSGIERIGPDSVYRIYSMTKPVVAAGIVLLVEDGRLALADPVAKYVPEFAGMTVLAGSLDKREAARPMTVGHLLTHSCGLANSWGDGQVAPLYRQAGLIASAWMFDPRIGGLEGFARRLAALPLEFQPGSNWIYGYGLDIAGLVVERVSDRRLGDFLQERIFGPLGMASTGFCVAEGQSERLAGLYSPRDGAPVPVADGSERNPLRRPFADSGSAGLVSTLDDYGRFADMLANLGRAGKRRVMSEASAKRMMTPYGPQAPLAAALERFGGYAPGSVGQALGGIVRLDDRGGPGSTGEYAWGGAAGTGFWATPGSGLSVTLMTQLLPATGVPVREVLRPLIYGAPADAG
ncbi:MAG TPA: hypothetical protein DDZ67_12270 [Xanthomonadaceae bacterium]|nr:hypothetical protein [Xanthomonadaceae bacterium]